MEYVVYILYSKKRLKYYVGQTHDIEKRFKRHNNGFVPSTKSGLPWELILTLHVKNRSEALKLETKIKKEESEDFLKITNSGCTTLAAWQDVAEVYPEYSRDYRASFGTRKSSRLRRDHPDKKIWNM